MGAAMSWTKEQLTKAKAFTKDLSKEFTSLLWYILFMSTFCIIIFSPRNQQPYLMKKSIEDRLVHRTWDDQATKSFLTINSRSDIQTWMEEVLVPQLYHNEYNDLEMMAGSMIKTGLVRIRTQRIDPSSCKLSQYNPSDVTHCIGLTEANTEWKNVSYGLSSDMKWYSTITKRTYGREGYIVDLPAAENETIALLEESFFGNDFLDIYTNVIFIEMNLYNPNVDLFAACRLVIELLPSGAIVSTSSIRSLPLITVYRVLQGDGASTFTIALFFLEFIFYGFVAAAVLHELSLILRKGWFKYFSDTWNVMEAINLSFFIIVIVLRCMTVVIVADIESYLVDQKDEYIPLDWVTWFMKQIDNVNAFNAVITFIKFFKYMRFSKKIAQLTHTIARASVVMTGVMVLILLMFYGFGAAFEIAYGSHLKEHRDIWEALFTLLRFTLGDFDMDDILETENSLIGLLFFFSFVIMMDFIMLSFFVGEVSLAYDDVRKALDYQSDSDPLSKDLMKMMEIVYTIAFQAYALIRFLFTGKDIRKEVASKKVEKKPVEKKDEKRRQSYGFSGLLQKKKPAPSLTKDANASDTTAAEEDEDDGDVSDGEQKKVRDEEIVSICRCMKTSLQNLQEGENNMLDVIESIEKRLHEISEL